MVTFQSPVSQPQLPTGQLKDSIRDMVQLQRDYHLSDEVFWEVFNARVLLNKDINVNEFLNDLKRSAARA